MPKFINAELEVHIKVLSKEKYSYSQIKKKLKQEGHNVSIGSICNVLKNNGIRRRALFNGQLCPKFRRPRTKRTKEVIQKVKNIVTKPNPTSYRDIAAKTSLSLASINTIIHKDLKLNTRKKTKTYELNAKQKKNRKTNCRKLYENHQQVIDANMRLH